MLFAYRLLLLLAVLLGAPHASRADAANPPALLNQPGGAALLDRYRNVVNNIYDNVAFANDLNGGLNLPGSGLATPNFTPLLTYVESSGLNIMLFGAKCNGQGDDTDAIGRAIRRAISGASASTDVFIPAASCPITLGKLSFTVPNGMTLGIHGPIGTAARLLVAEGAGDALTITLQGSNAISSNGVAMSSFAQSPGFAIENISFVAMFQSIHSTALHVTMVGGYGPSVYENNLSFTPGTPGTTGWQNGAINFGTNIDGISNIWCEYWADSTTSSCVTLDTDSRIDVLHKITNIDMNGGGVTLSLGHTGGTGALQGLHIDHIGTSSHRGIDILSANNLDEINVTNSEFSNPDYAIRNIGGTSLQVTSNYFLQNAVSIYDTGSAARLTATGNIFYGGPLRNSPTPNYPIVLDGIGGGPASGAMISGNVFTNLYSAGTGSTANAAPVQIINGSNYVYVSGNFCLGQLCANNTVGASNFVGPNVESSSALGGTYPVMDDKEWFLKGLALGNGGAPAVLSGDGVGNALLAGNFLLGSGAVSALNGYYFGGKLTGDHITDDSTNSVITLTAKQQCFASPSGVQTWCFISDGVGNAKLVSSLANGAGILEMTASTKLDNAIVGTQTPTIGAACVVGAFTMDNTYIYGCPAGVWRRNGGWAQ